MNPELDPETQAQWPRRLVALCDEVRGRAPEPSTRAMLWNLLRDSLHSMLRHESKSFPGTRLPDLEDLASAKALDLLLRAERGEWSPEGRTNGEVVNYLRATARHALSRHAETRSRALPLDGATSVPEEWADSLEDRAPSAARASDPVEAREFTDALLDCLSTTPPRARFAWYLRAVHEMASRDIAAHPKVAATVANVDVILMRVRAHLKDCLARKDFEPGPLPSGVFTLLWNSLARGQSWAADSSEIP